MTEIITTAISDRICKHMNEDHADTLPLYAKCFGKVSDVKNAKMLSIDNEAMYLAIDENSDKPLKIKFDHNLEDAKDAHTTLVSMLKTAKKTN